MSKYQIHFDPTDAEATDEHDTIGSFLLDSAGVALTSTLVGSDQALDVNIVQTSGQYDEDSAATSGDAGDFVLTVRQDTLAASTDTDGDYAAFKSNATGELYVTDATVRTDLASLLLEVQNLSFAEDSAHVSGDVGTMPLAVRNDAGGTMVSADGDYSPLQVNDTGELRIAGSFSMSCPNNSVVNTATAVNNTATDLVGTDLANRQEMWIANIGNDTAFIGSSSVTAATGFPIGRRSYVSICAGANIDIHAITSGASKTADMRIMELA